MNLIRSHYINQKATNTLLHGIWMSLLNSFKGKFKTSRSLHCKSCPWKQGPTKPQWQKKGPEKCHSLVLPFAFKMGTMTWKFAPAIWLKKHFGDSKMNSHISFPLLKPFVCTYAKWARNTWKPEHTNATFILVQQFFFAIWYESTSTSGITWGIAAATWQKRRKNYRDF